MQNFSFSQRGERCSNVEAFSQEEDNAKKSTAKNVISCNVFLHGVLIPSTDEQEGEGKAGREMMAWVSPRCLSWLVSLVSRTDASDKRPLKLVDTWLLHLGFYAFTDWQRLNKPLSPAQLSYQKELLCPSSRIHAFNHHFTEQWAC